MRRHETLFYKTINRSILFAAPPLALLISLTIHVRLNPERVFADSLNTDELPAVSTNFGAKPELAPAQKQVKIYFPRETGNDATNGELQAVTRSVNAAAPLRPALEALLAGPNAAEKAKGFYALDTEGLSLVKLTVTNGAARANFARAGGERWTGDLSPFIFRQAVERTMKQFPSVKSVRLCVDGAENFGDLSGKPPRPCR